MLDTTCREICKCCHNINCVGFYVPNDIWALVVPYEFFRKALCLDCFIRFADEKGIEWDKDIKFFPVSLYTNNKCKKDIIESAKALVDKLKEITNHPAYFSVFSLAANHGMPYSGPNFSKELENLQNLLKQ